ncbi:hypothetical protein [Actinokineospora sp. NBRC 105648]|uniref:hypothetical protein n=1 Tax=Actinokineospora sp. NBRC 105648 TaxID=3032206 RepID=UPI0024A59404|nr:hypothetical protein [Actinokineospora sp. NBRC 105648]GLZ39302.1 hypothetical protein Acsp05_29260 [Actinokineospora sp. NBRC 105648]
MSKRLIAVAAALLTAGATLTGPTATAAPDSTGPNPTSPNSTTAVTHTYDFESADLDSNYDDGETSGYWVDRDTAQAHGGTKSARYRIRSFTSAGKPWIQWVYYSPQQSAALPVSISFWVHTTAGGPANTWSAAAYAATTDAHDDTGSPTAGWQYTSVTQTSGTWKKYTFTTTVNTIGKSELYTAVGIKATFPATRTYYIDDATVTVG